MTKIIRALRVLVTRRLTFTFDKVEFTFHRLSRKRLLNWFLSEMSYVLRLSRSLSKYPTHLQFEPGNLCNLRCPLCHVVTDHKSRGQLDPNDFKRIMDELGDHLLLLQLWGWGEPFLNPAIFEMIGHAKAKGIKVISSTNGHWLIDPAMVDSVIDSGLDVLICALDGVDQDTYQKYRAQGDFNQVVKGIASLARRKKERGASTPLINLRMLVTRENEDQVERMTQLGREIGVDILTFKTLNSFDNPEKGDSLQPRNHAFRRFTYDPQGQPVRVRNTCKKPWNHPTLYHDGTVVPCDYFTGEEYSLPSCFVDGTKSFARVWRGPEFLDFRRLFPGGPPEAPRCGSCSLNFAPETRCVSDILKYTP